MKAPAGTSDGVITGGEITAFLDMGSNLPRDYNSRYSLRPLRGHPVLQEIFYSYEEKHAGILRKSQPDCKKVSVLLSLDIQLLKLINVSLADPLLTRFMLFVTDKHNWFPIIGAVAVFLLVAGRKLPHPGNIFQSRNPRVFLFGVILCVLVSDQAGGLLKDNVARIRPNRDPEYNEILNCPLHTAGRRSFPSNHAANAASIAVFTALFYPPLAVPALLTAFLIGFSRVYLAVHFPSDVIAGWLIGSMMGYLVWLLLGKRSGALGITGFANMFRFRQHQVVQSPGSSWKEVSWFSLDGIPVSGFLLEGSGNLVIFIHGMGGSAVSRGVLGEKLHLLNGCSFLLVPLRGSDGHPVRLTSGGVDEAHDVLGALRFAVSRGFDPSEIIIYGTSMGGAAAIKACALAGDLLPAGLIVHGAFRRFFQSASNRTGSAGAALLGILMPDVSVRNLKRFDSVYWLKHCNRGCTKEYIYGELDTVCPPADGKILADAVPGRASTFTELENRGHPTGRNTSDDEFANILNRAIERIQLKSKKVIAR